jgi:hypothetical protein
VEEVDKRAGVEAGLLVVGRECEGMGVLFGMEYAADVDFQTLCEVAFELEVRLEDVCGRPRLSERHAVFGVGVLGLQVALDDTLLVAVAHDAEGDARRRACLDLERGAVDGEVLGQEVVGRLADILRRTRQRR